MPSPRLIHPVNVTFEVFNQADMLMDDQARAPIHGARSQPGDVYKIPCQVSWNKKDDPAANIGGTVTESIGYFLARKLDMDQILGPGVRLKRGDRITQYESFGPVTEVVTCDLYILRGDPYGHYPERGASLYKYHVTDRDPVQ